MSPAERLRQRLQQPGILIMPGCHDAMSARLIEEAGFVAQRMLQDDPAAARRHVERWFGGREELLDA